MSVLKSERSIPTAFCNGNIMHLSKDPLGSIF